ncbi:MAG: undecaprenyl/decaprenyl-phosphate alpha-N-acetylglucosaminyl 1-phosphate transferase [Planctomycetes bacterium]|nr:undecaprenyl/decaprenyl-phosphate alpha-N-acetylglucosaminyl 1-phosphate transferase [Planctomycetota bacterium]
MVAPYFYGVSLIFGIAGTALLVPAIRRFAMRAGAMAHPGPRSIHTGDVPLWGGLALFIPWAAIALSILFLDPFGTSEKMLPAVRLLALVYGAAVIVVFGMIDDRWGIAPGIKLFGQFLAIVILLRAGYAIRSLAVPFAGTIDFGVFGPLIFGIWVLAITNAFNLIDGMDGLAAGVAFFAAGTSAVLAIDAGNAFVAASALCLAGSLLAFLKYNFPPARIFLGDTGSLLVGFLLACLVAQAPSQKGSAVLTIFAPILPVAFAIVDVLFAVARRILRGKPIFAPDRRHIHHRLLEKFHHPRRVLAVLYAFCAITAAGTILLHFRRSNTTFLFVAGTFFVLALGFGKLIDLFRIREVMAAFQSNPHFRAIHAFLRYARVRLRTAGSTEEALRILELGAECLHLENLQIEDQAGHILVDWRRNGSPAGCPLCAHRKLNSGHWRATWCVCRPADAAFASEIEIVWGQLLDATSGTLTRLETESA